jgi:hypothetical protein
MLNNTLFYILRAKVFRPLQNIISKAYSNANYFYLGMNFALYLFVCSCADSMLGITVDYSNLAVLTFVGKMLFLFEQYPCLNDYNIIFLVDSCICGQRNSSLFSNTPNGHISGASLSLCVPSVW